MPLHRAREAFFSRTAHSAQLRPTDYRLLGASPSPGYLFESVVVVLAVIGCVTGVVRRAFRETGLIGWATR